MSEQRSLIVGFDLCNDYSQISCYNTKSLEPESICIASDQTKYLIPTAIGVKHNTKDWIFGEDAILCGQAGTGIVIDNLLVRIAKQEETEVLGVKFPPVTLLEKYLRKCLLLLKIYYPSNSIQKIVVTLKDQSNKLMDEVYTALGNLGIGKDRAVIQNHSQSYQYYALSQNKELWMNDVGLFELNEEGLTYHQLTINRKTHPYIVSMTHKDLSDTLQYSMLEEYKGSEKLEYIFENIANSVLHKQAVSTIYVTGKGFESNWADNVLKRLCRGRRVFKGQNLYTKGACYAAKEYAGDHKLDDYIFQNENMIMNTFILHGYYDAKNVEVVLAKATLPWHEVDERIDLILDGEQEIIIYVTNVNKRETTPYHINLTGLPDRPPKTTRVELGIMFKNRTTAIITVKDKGFGVFYPSTNQIWENEILIQQ